MKVLPISTSLSAWLNAVMPWQAQARPAGKLGGFLQFKSNTLANGVRGSHQAGERYLIVGWIQDSIELRTARLQTLGERGFRNLSLFHGLAKLPSHDSLDGLRGCLLEVTF